MSSGCSSNKPVSIADAIRKEYAKEGKVSLDFLEKLKIPDANEVFLATFAFHLSIHSPGVLEDHELRALREITGGKQEPLFNELKQRLPSLTRFKHLVGTANQWCLFEKCQKEREEAAAILAAPPQPTKDVERNFIEGARRYFIKDPQNGNSWNQLSDFLFSIEKYKESLEAEEKAFQLTGDIQRLREMTLSYAGLDNIEKVAETCERATRHKNAASVDYACLGAGYTSTGKHQEAIALLKARIEIEPNYAPYRNILGGAYTNLGNYAEGLTHFKKAVELESGVANFQANVGYALYKLGHCQEATPYLKEAIRLDPNLASAHRSLGEVYFNLKNYPLAVEAFEKAYNLDNNIYDLRHIADIYRELKKEDKFVETLTRIVNHKDATEEDRLNLAQAKSGKPAEPKKSLEKVEAHAEKNVDDLREAVGSTPDNKENYYNLVQKLLEVKQFKEALPYAKKAIALWPKDMNFHAWLGEAYAGMGGSQKYVLAKSSYVKALSLCETDKQQARVLGLLGDLYLKSYNEAKYPGDKKDAIQYYQKAVKLDPDNKDFQDKLTNARKLAR